MVICTRGYPIWLPKWVDPHPPRSRDPPPAGSHTRAAPQRTRQNVQRLDEFWGVNEIMSRYNQQVWIWAIFIYKELYIPILYD